MASLQGALFFGGAGLLIGLGLDAVHVGHTTVYAVPSLGGRRGAADAGRLAVGVVWRW